MPSIPICLFAGCSFRPFCSSSDITIYELTPEERQAFQEASEPVYEIFGKEIGVDLLNRVREFLADPANQ